MSVTKVQGKNVTLLIYNIDGAYSVYCGQDVSISINTEMLPSTNIQSKGYRAFTPGKTDWDVTFSGVTMVKDTSDANFIVFDLTTEQARKNGFPIYVVYTNDNGNTETFSGYAYPTTTQVTGTVGQLSKFQTKFQGSGAFQRNQSIPQSKANDVKSYTYTATGTEPNSFQFSDLVFRKILLVLRGSSPMQVILGGTPNAQQVLYDSGSGTLTFDVNSPFVANEKIIVLYV